MAASKRTNPRRRIEPRRVAFGGSLVRDFQGLPGMLEKFFTITRRYPKALFNASVKSMEAAFGHTNAEPVTDDVGNIWPAGSLFHLGSDGTDSGGTVVLVHKFVPISALYPPVSFNWLENGESV